MERSIQSHTLTYEPPHTAHRHSSPHQPQLSPVGRNMYLSYWCVPDRRCSGGISSRGGSDDHVAGGKGGAVCKDQIKDLTVRQNL